VALFFLLVFLPVSLVHAATLNVRFVSTNDVISGLNPSSAAFDIVYEAGFIKSEDLSTTFGSYMQIIPRYSGTAGAFNYTDGVAVLSGGNIYFKMLRLFPGGTVQRGAIVGSDGTFAGTTGSLELISGNLYQVTFP
jgi:hypothetical protein